MRYERSHKFLRHHLDCLLFQIGVRLPCWLDGSILIRESRNLEQHCWRKLGYAKQPVFEGDLPDFLMTDGGGNAVNISNPTDPAVLANRMAISKPSPMLEKSHTGANFKKLGQLLSLTPFELQWLVWACCVRHFGIAILPVVPLRDRGHGCEVLAQLCDVPVAVVQYIVTARRLYTWGFLADSGDDRDAPLVLSDWLIATSQFVECIEQPYVSDLDLLVAICQAQVSLMASR